MSAPSPRRSAHPPVDLAEPYQAAIARHRARLERSSVPARINWLRAVVGPFARALATRQLLGDSANESSAAEIILATLGLGEGIGASRDEAVAAARAVVVDAHEHALDVTGHLGRGLRPLAKARAPAAMLMAEARRIAARHDQHLSDDMLIEACRIAAHAAAPSKRGGRRHAGR